MRYHARMEMQALMLVNRDGKRMPSTLRLPEGQSKGTVILLHGLGGLRDQKLLTLMAEALTNEGYVTFAFEDSHAVRSLDARFFEATASQSIRDTEDVVAYVQAQSWYEAPLILLGHSMGGFTAVHHARMHPKDAEKLVLLAPAMSWKTMWGASLPFLFLWFITGKQKVFSIDNNHAVLGRAWILDWFKHDALRDARYVTSPTLIVSAGHDETVATPSEHQHFAKKFAHATQVTIRGADHDFGEQEQETIDTVIEWLRS